jgi:hypothetical protein
LNDKLGSIEKHFFSFFLDARFEKSRKAFFLRKPFLHFEITFFFCEITFFCVLRKPFLKSENKRLGDRKYFSARTAKARIK